MGRKRNRQSDIPEDGSEGSSESCGETTEPKTENEKSENVEKCKHLLNSVNNIDLRKAVKKSGIQRECQNCEKDVTENNSDPPAMWMCLQCGNQACGQYNRSHAKEHFKTPRTGSHCLAADTNKWSVWCYECDIFVDIDSCSNLNNAINELKRIAGKGRSKPSSKGSQRSKGAPKELAEPEKGKQKVLFGLTKVVGLTNLGNTCFFNAVLQCLAQTPFLVKVLEDLQKPGQTFVLPGGKYKKPGDSEEIILPPIEGTLEFGNPFTQALQKTLTDMQNGNSNETYKPSELLNTFRRKSSQCMDGGQHDSHELLRHLLEIVRSEDLRRYQSVILKNLDAWKTPDIIDEDKKSRVKFYGHQASARLLGPERVFQGILVSTLECLECHHSSSRTEPFLDLSLPVMPDKPHPAFKRKSSGFEDAFDLMSSNSSSNGNKPLRKREAAAAKKAAKKEQKNLKNIRFLNSTVEKTGDCSASAGSETDVEDNVDTESGTEPPSNSQEIIEFLHLESSENLNGDRLENPNSEDNSTALELHFENSLENKENSMPDLISPDSTTANLISSSNNSVESPSSPGEKEVNDEKVVEDEKIQENGENSKETSPEDEELKFYGPEPDPLSIISAKNEIPDDYSNTNGVGKITTDLSRVEINRMNQSPTRYSTCDRELSIQSCLNQFTAQELMAGNNVVGCEACTAKENKGKEKKKMVCTPSTKQYLISKVPAVLILHLKRFQSQRFGFGKVMKHVDFPTLIDLAPVCKDHKKKTLYSLYGIVEHSGTLYGGHYVAYVKTRQPLNPNDPRWSFLPTQESAEAEKRTSDVNSQPENEENSNASNIEPPPGRWYYISDSRVSEVDEDKVLQSQAYLLFYERIL